MRICFFHSGFVLHGGIERVLSIIIRSLHEKENIDIYCLSLNQSEPLDFYLLPTDLKTDYLFEDLVNMKKAFLKGGIWKLVRYLRKNQIDVIIACGVMFFPMACIAAKLAGVKAISWEHTDPARTGKFVFEGISRRFGACFSDMNVLISQEAREYYECHFRKKRNIVIYNPADSRLYETNSSYQADSKKLISVGRLTYQKNYQLLIDIADKLLIQHDGWVWHIYGDGEDREELEQLIFEKDLSDRVVLMGNVADLYDRYPEYSAIVMTSRYEGFPMVLIEAAAKGLPMVSFDISTGPKEIIDDNVNGFLIPSGDVNGMLAKLNVLMADSDMRSQFSTEAKKKVTSFKVDNISDQWCQLFNELTNNQ